MPPPLYERLISMGIRVFGGVWPKRLEWMEEVHCWSWEAVNHGIDESENCGDEFVGLEAAMMEMDEDFDDGMQTKDWIIELVVTIMA